MTPEWLRFTSIKKEVSSPAVALFSKSSVDKICQFWISAESFLIPVPVTAISSLGPTVMVKTLAPASKTIPLTSTPLERTTFVMFDAANVAISDGPFGTVFGVQFAAVFQSPELGFIFHVALSANADVANANVSSTNAAMDR